MKNQLVEITTLLTLAIGIATTANAQLFDRGNGMLYDSDQNLTWLQDANHAETSGHATDGEMDWATATSWAASLTYGGFDDWRLPTITDEGNDGCNFSYNGTDCGFNVNTSGSELAHMWYNILGNTALRDTNGDLQAGWGLTSTSSDGVSILNLQEDFYWSGTGYALGYNLAWSLNADFGEQDGTNADDEYHAWAVRSGDVSAATVPEPGTLLLLVAGLVSIAGAKRRHH